MASPQLKHGFARLANTILEALAVYPWTSPLALRLVLFVVRQSYGFNRKKTGPFSLAELAERMRAPRSSVHLALEVLIKSSVLTRDDLGRLALQKNYDAWAQPVQPTGQKAPAAVQSTGQQTDFSASSVAVQSAGQPDLALAVQSTGHFVQPAEQSVQPTGRIKEKDNLKDNFKDTHITAPPAAIAAVRDPLEGFSAWYDGYPEKKARGAAERAWKALRVDPELQAKLVAAVEAQKRQRALDEQRGVFVPRWAYPATWLNQKRWMDETTPAAAGAVGAGVRAAAGKYAGIGERHDLA